MVLALVVQKMDKAIHWINLYPLDSQLVSQILIRRIVVCPVESAIQRLNNPGLVQYSANFMPDAVSVPGLILTLADGKVLCMHEGGQ